MTLHARILRALLVGVLVGVPLAFAQGSPVMAAPDASRTYTLDADFDDGTSNNVVHSTPGQLQLDDTVTAFPFIWVALSARGTIAKIDTATGQVLGEYSTTSDGDGGHNPSRTTVANDGSVWAGNRNQSSVIHVGLEEAGQCVDRNGNGTIQTSSGYGNVLAWPGGFGGASSPVSNALDECILHYVDTAGGDARHVSVDGAGDIWVGNWSGSPHTYQKLDGSTGAILTSRTMPCGGYGGLVDGNGVLWSANQGTSVLRWDPAEPDAPGVNPRCVPASDSYGMAFDSNNNIWVSTLSSGRVYKITPNGATVTQFNTGNPNAQGLAVDGNDHVWISSSLFNNTNRIAHLRNDGTLVGHVTGAGGGSTGVSVDAAGKIWTANINSNDATRIDPNAGPLNGSDHVGAFDLTVPLPGAGPYNYSDMTGSTLTGKPDSGSWTVVYDSGIPGAEWGTVDWTADLPSDSDLTFSAASSSDGVTFGPAQPVTAASDLTVGNGRYLRVTATFVRATTPAEESPILYDVTISTADLNEPPVADAGGPYTGDEGAAIGISGTATDADGDSLTYSWAPAGSVSDAGASCTIADPTALTTSVTCDDDGTFDLELTVDDGNSPPVTSIATVTVGNVAPSVDITAPAEGTVVPVGTLVAITGDFDDDGANDLGEMSCTVDWKDGSAPTPASVAGTACSDNHTYTSPGVYDIAMAVDDQDGGTATDNVLVVVYDPSAGFVTGGGTIESPLGAYAADPSLTGRASFGFVSKYKKGATVPEGQTQFQFQAAGFTFHSTSYQWLVVSGAKAQFKGAGTVNGAGNYGFMLTAVDGQLSGGGGSDRVRLKVWNLSDDSMVYDSGLGAGDDTTPLTTLQGGSIVIHKN